MRWEQAEELRADPGSNPAEREGRSGRGRSFWPTLAVSAAALGFGAVIWFAYQNGRDLSGSGQPPLIKADQGPVKVKPDQPGGEEIPFQDSTVYDRLGQKDKQPTMEKLLPPPETPVERPQPAPQAQAAVPAPTSPQAADSAPGALAPNSPSPSPAVSGPPPQPAQAAAPAALPIQATPIQPTPAQSTPTQSALAQPDPIGALAAAAVAAKPVPAPKQAAAPTGAALSGSYRIQLSAVRTADAVGPEWARLKHHFPDTLAALKMASDTVDVAGKGTFFRILAGPLDQNGAKSACEHLKAQGVGCIVLKP